ncbi:hypothetical protein GW17_00035970, partial [Ensete ventricosum]
FGSVRSGSVPVSIDFDNRRSISGSINRGRKKKRESKKREKMKIIRSGVGLPPQAISSPCTGRKNVSPCRRSNEVTRRGRRWKFLDPVLVFARGRFLLPTRVEETHPRFSGFECYIRHQQSFPAWTFFPTYLILVEPLIIAIVENTNLTTASSGSNILSSELNATQQPLLVAKEFAASKATVAGLQSHYWIVICKLFQIIDEKWY